MGCDAGQIWRWLWTTLRPWISLALGPVLVISTAGQSLIHSAFYSGEQLARSLSEFLLWCIGGIWAGLAVLEWLLRVVLRRRAKRLSATPAQTE
jgi:hypothetical protein